MARLALLGFCAALAGLGAPMARAQTPLFRVLGEQVPPDAGKVIRAADVDLDGDVDLLTTNRVLLNDGAERFTPGAPMPSGLALVADPPAMALGDLNGDGLPDLVAGASPWVGIALNNGASAFGGFLPIAAGVGAPVVYAKAIALADVDGDGDLDVCVTSFAFTATLPQTSIPLQPRLFLNGGSGALTEVTASRLPSMSVFGDVAELVDFDGDGDVDLFLSRATASPNPTNPPAALAVLLLNVGAGFFSAPIPVPGPGTPANAALGDLNGDGLPDVVYAPVESSTVSPTTSSGVVFNLGAGAFGPFVSSPLPAARVLARDLNGDGLAEVIRSAASGLTVHSVSPGGAIGGASQTIAVSSVATVARDLDSDGDVDLCVDGGNRKTLVFNDGTGTLVPIEGHMRVPASSAERVVGDVDGDGDVDFVWAPVIGAGAQIQVAFNDGRGNFQPGPFCGGTCPAIVSTSRLMPLDFDADGLLDLWVAATFSTTLPTAAADVLYRGTGSGWTQVATLAGPAETGTVLAGDLDGDSDRDLVVVRHTPAMGSGIGPASTLVLFNQGPAGFSAPVPLAAPLAGLDGVLFDADGDGDLDLVETVAQPAGATSVLFLNDGAGGFTQAAGGALPSAITGLIFAGDLDGDGDVDLVMDAQTSLNGGTGSFAPGPALPFGTWATALFDADGDGDLDLLQQGIANGSSTTWIFMNGGGPFAGTFPSSQVVGSAWGFGPLADCDGDGDIDLIGPGPLLFSNTTRQIARGAIVRPGQNAVLEIYGPPAAPYFLYASLGPAQIPVPPWGTVFIDPASAFLVTSGAFSATGAATLVTAVPNTPAVIGMSAHLQAALPLQLRLSNLEVLTVLGL